MTIWQLRSDAIENAETDAGNLATVLAEQTARSVQSIDLVITELKQQIERDGIATPNDFRRLVGTEAIHRILSEYLGRLRQVDVIAILDKDGAIVNSTRSWPPPQAALSDRDYFQHFQTTADEKLFISLPTVSRVTGISSQYFSKRIATADGEFAGLILVAVNTEYFQHIYSSVNLLNGMSFLLLRNDGTMLMRHPYLVDRPGKKMPANALWYPVVERGGGYYRSPGYIDDEARLVAVRPLREYPLVVDVSISESAALATWRNRSTLIGGGVLFAVLCGAFLLRALAAKFGEIEQANRQASIAHAQLRTALDVIPEGVVFYDAEDRFVLWNEQYRQILDQNGVMPAEGMRYEDFLRARLGHLRHRDAKGREEEWLAERLKEHSQPTGRREYQLTDGRWIRLEERRTPDGGRIGVRIDITDLKQREASFRLLFENNPVPMWVYDRETLKFLAVNEAAIAHYGYSRETFLKMTMLDVRPAGERDRTQRMVRSGQHDTSVGHQRRHVKADGTEIDVIVFVHSLQYDDHAASIAAIIDVTERKRAAEKITHLAHYDALTDLPNRALFYEELDRALERVRAGERLALLYLDLDHFKRANDTLGHQVGDVLLSKVADRLRRCVRGSDLVARLGGDEFAVLQTPIETPSDAATLATRIGHALKAPFDLDGRQVLVDVSIGIAIAPNDGAERDELMKNADLTLYEAKGSGRGSYSFYEAELRSRLQAQQTLETDLRAALAKGELELYYQPIVNLQSNHVVGCEALLRWHHPERGLVAPKEFIPVAEESGMITAIGEWVLQQACADAATWPEDMHVAVNLSPVQLNDKTLVPLVVRALASSGLPGHRLELEITETVLMQNTFATLATLHQLHAVGVKIALDDFGTGYSSLSYLGSFPFDKIKIDRSFHPGYLRERCQCRHRAVDHEFGSATRHDNHRRGHRNGSSTTKGAGARLHRDARLSVQSSAPGRGDRPIVLYRRQERRQRLVFRWRCGVKRGATRVVSATATS